MAWLRQRIELVHAFLLSAATLVLLRLTSTSVGFTRDEGYYFKAAEDYVTWYRRWMTGQTALREAFSRALTDRFFSYNHEHPALVKTLQGFTWWLFHETLGISSNAEAFRLPGPLFSSLTVACTYLLAARFYGRRVALLAALAWPLLPRNFFDEHLACFDVPVTAMTLLVVTLYAYAGSSVKRAVWVGVAYGLTMATKHNSLFIPPLLVIHFAVVEGPRLRRSGTWITLPGIPMVFVMMALLGPLILLLHWPWLWNDTTKRLGEYYGYHFLAHEHYPITYFGELLRQPPFPWGFAFGMTLFTVPLPILGLSVVGLLLAVKEGFFTRAHHGPEAVVLRGHAWLMGLFTLFPMVVISLPSTPIFGGTKHWMPATPFLCILAGRGLVLLLDRARSVLPERMGYAVALPLVLLTCVTGILRSAPHGHCYYNELAGGARGAADTFQRHFWGEASRPIIPVLNAQAPQNVRTFFNRTNYDDWRMYVRDGVVRRDIGFAQAVTESQAAFAFHQWEHEHELYNIWNAYPLRKPVAGVYLEGGVPLTSLYLR